MQYSKEKDIVFVSLDELCLEAVGRFAGREQPSGEFWTRDSLLFGSPYEAKLNICAEIEHGGVNYQVEGQIDGVFSESGVWTADTVCVVPEELFSRRPKPELEMYATLSAALLAHVKQATVLKRRIVLINRENGGIRTLVKSMTASELFGCLDGVLAGIAPRVRRIIRREKLIRPSAAEVVFPYPEIRDGQLQMIRRGMAAIRRGGKLFACAPTGIGKTMSALYPAVRAYGEGLCDKIFYLTAKSSTSGEAYQAAKRLYEAGAHLRTIVLTAKEQICPSGRAGGHCNARECVSLRGYGERVRAALEELLDGHNGFYAALITQIAEKYRICPYELSLDLSEFCDIIVCDYNYLFDPSVHLRRYFDETRFGQYVFLVDEAHNLVDRARELYSVTLTRNGVEHLLSCLPKERAEQRMLIQKLLLAFEGARALCRSQLRENADGSRTGYDIRRERPEDFERAVRMLDAALADWLRKNREDEFFEMLSDFERELSKYITISEHYDEKFITYIETANEEVCVSLTCMDPSDVVSGALAKGRASILFSATLTPLTYFYDLLGGDKQTEMIEPESPYEHENLCVAAVDSISTRFEDRDKTARRVATYIAAAVSPKPGNYIVYFPSYGYLEKVHVAFCKKYPEVCTVLQKRGMKMREKEEFLAAFREDVGKLRIGFCVLGGLFSEGVDLPGSRLIGSIIVGVGLPGFSSTRNIMRDYFENRYENGFEYAYTYPGMNHVLQAAGRVIRREDDRGIVVLIDDRYGTPTYQKLFPQHWKHLKYAGNPSSLAEITRKFWEK